MNTIRRHGRHGRLARTLVLPLLAAILGAACTEAESRGAPEGSAEPAEPERVRVATGTSMTFAVDQAVSTASHAEGSTFTATLTAPVLDERGQVALAPGTRSRWGVTESTTRDGQAVLAIRLESIQIDGAWMPLSATVVDATIDSDHPDSGKETAAKIGVGTAAGAILGQILGGDTKATLSGAGVGAVVGTAVALSTRGGSATLPQGSTIVVELDAPLAVS